MKPDNTFTIFLSNGVTTLTIDENIDHPKKKTPIRLTRKTSTKNPKSIQTVTSSRATLKAFLEERTCITCKVIRVTFSKNHPMPHKLTCCGRTVCFLCMKDNEMIKNHIIQNHKEGDIARLQEEDQQTIITLGNLVAKCTEGKCSTSKKPKLLELFKIEEHFDRKHQTTKTSTQSNQNNESELLQLTHTTPPPSPVPKLRRSFSFQSFFSTKKTNETQSTFPPTASTKQTDTLMLSRTNLERSQSLLQFVSTRSTSPTASIRRAGSESLQYRFSEAIEAENQAALADQEKGAVGGISPDRATGQDPRSFQFPPELAAEIQKKIHHPDPHEKINQALKDPHNPLTQCVSLLIQHYSKYDPQLFWVAAKQAILDQREYLQSVTFDAFNADVCVRVAGMSDAADVSELLPPPSVP